MKIRTKRLLLRPLGLDDLLSVHEYASDLENTRYMMFLPNYTREETKDFLSSVEREWKKSHPSFFEFAVVLNGVQIGAVSIYLSEISGQSEIGWILNKKYWNCGYISEAASAVLTFAKEKLCLNRVIAHCDGRNIASARVMEKLGMNLASDNGTRAYVKRNEVAKELTYIIDF